MSENDDWLGRRGSYEQKEGELCLWLSEGEAGDYYGAAGSSVNIRFLPLNIVMYIV